MKNISKKNYKEQLSKVWKLSIPAILTQIATIVMQYIDSAMVGKLGEDASASIGLVATTTWLFSGLLTAASMGFAVQIAHSFGADDIPGGRKILRHGLIFSLIFSILIMVIGIFIAKPLPIWLGAEEKIWKDASIYFLVFSITIPFQQLTSLTACSLQCSGDMVIPSVLNAVMCILDVIFNAILIPKYQVLGAAIGTALAVFVTSVIMFYLCCFKINVCLSNRHARNLSCSRFRQVVLPKVSVLRPPRRDLRVCGHRLHICCGHLQVTGWA